jgi:hypothetical protein
LGNHGRVTAQGFKAVPHCPFYAGTGETWVAGVAFPLDGIVNDPYGLPSAQMDGTNCVEKYGSVFFVHGVSPFKVMGSLFAVPCCNLKIMRTLACWLCAL